MEYELDGTEWVCWGHCCLDIVRLAVHIRDRYNFQTLCFPPYELKLCTVNIVILGFMCVFLCVSRINSHWIS